MGSHQVPNMGAGIFFIYYAVFKNAEIKKN
jgi:hypothetical protein